MAGTPAKAINITHVCPSIILSGECLFVGLTGLNMVAIRNTGLVACAGIGSPLSGLAG